MEYEHILKISILIFYQQIISHALSSDIHLYFPSSHGFITSIKGTTLKSNFQYSVFSPSPTPTFAANFANLNAQTALHSDNYHSFTARLFSDTLTPGTPVRVIFHRHKVETDVTPVCPIVYGHLEVDRSKSLSGHCWINETNSACIVQLSIDLKWWPYHQNIEDFRLLLYYGIDETCTFSPIDPIYFQQEYIDETIPETNIEIIPESAKLLRGKRNNDNFENIDDQIIDEVANNFNPDFSDNFRPKLQNLGFVSLIPDRTTFQETKEDQNVLIYFPKVAYAPGSLFRIPIKLQAGSKLHSFNISLNLKKRNDVKSKAIIAQFVNDSSWTIAMNSKPMSHLVQVSSDVGHAHSGILHLFDWWFAVEENSQVRDSIRLPFLVEYTLNNGGQKIMNKVVISVSVQQDRICGIVTILDSNKLFNLASFNGIEQKFPVVVYAASHAGHHYNVTAQSTCQSTDDLVIQTSTACLNIVINKMTTKPSDGTKIIARYGRHSTEFTVTVFVAEIPMRIELSDARLQQIAAWFVASTDDEEDFNSTSHNCQLKFQSTLINLYATFHTNSSYTQPLLITPYFMDHIRIVDTSVAHLRNQFVIDGLKPGKTDIEVFSHDNVTLASHQLKVSGEKVHLVSMSTTLVEDIEIIVQPIDNQIHQLLRQERDNRKKKKVPTATLR